MLSGMDILKQFLIKNYIYILKVVPFWLKSSTDYFDIFYITAVYILTI